MAKCKSKRTRSPRTVSSVPRILHPDAAGIDIGSTEHWVAVPPDRDSNPVRRFGCFTEELRALADWLQQCAIRTVAIESTGVYWVPLVQILAERGLEICLVNARHVQSLPGRKTDVLDCQWLQELHTYGLLSSSFRPADEICVLRSYWRHRSMLIDYASAHLHHMQKALTQMNLHLHHVISDISGVTGLRMIRAIVQGERNPHTLAELKDRRIQASSQTIAKALTGDYRAEHVFALKQALELYDVYAALIQQCDAQIEAYFNRFVSRVDPLVSPPPPAKTKPRKNNGNYPDFDLRLHLYRIYGTDFTQVEGLDSLTVIRVFAEVGLDHSRFPTSKRFCSWMCLCSNNKITGGKVKSSRSRPSANRAAAAFRLAAQSLSHSKGPLGSWYRRMRARLGPPQAITAAAHKLARIFYRLWTNPSAYDPTRLESYERQHQLRVLESLKKKAHLLGFQLVPHDAPETRVATEVS